MKKVFSRWPLSAAIVVGLLLILSAVFSRAPTPAPLFPPTDAAAPGAEAFEARKTVGEVISHAEEKLLTVLSLQMGIVAFAATMLFGKDFSAQRPRELFGILIFLIVILALVYLHLYRDYLGTYAYAVQLESGLPASLRSYQQIYQHLAEPEAPWLLRPIISLTNTFYIISFLPVYVVIVVSIGFGRKLGVRGDTIWAINITVAAWAVAYLLPVFRTIAGVGG